MKRGETKRDRRRAEYGDFQTPRQLAEQVCRTVAARRFKPASILEPTCGTGTMLLSALDSFSNVGAAIGIELNRDHLRTARIRLANSPLRSRVELRLADFFRVDWQPILSRLPSPTLVIGNLPWVTNAALGVARNGNRPARENLDGLCGLDAVTGKSNFDISEWMLRRLIAALEGRSTALAMLCKTAVARSVLAWSWRNSVKLSRAALLGVDAVAHFKASVDACLLYAEFRPGHRAKRQASVYECIEKSNEQKQRPALLGFRNGHLIADLTAFRRTEHLLVAPDCAAPTPWRSGIKHDCTRVMEFCREGSYYCNGYGEHVELEGAFLYPMLKGAQLQPGSTQDARRWMLVTQRNIGDDTDVIRRRAPLTWQYIESHAAALDGRRSSIYRGRPRYSLFGVGEYSFAPWKVAVGGFAKTPHFAVIGPRAGKPTVLDDTCYFLPCPSREWAERLAARLNSPLAREFFQAHVFWDSKRPITVDVLRRLDLTSLAVACESDHTENWPGERASPSVAATE